MERDNRKRIPISKPLKRALEYIHDPRPVTAKEWLTLSEAARELGVSRNTLYRRALAGKAPFHKYGVFLLFSRKEFRELMRENPGRRKETFIPFVTDYKP